MESRLFRSILLRSSSLTIACLAAGPLLHAQLPPPVSNAAGVQMAVDAVDRDPALAVTVPDGPPDARSFKILFPNTSRCARTAKPMRRISTCFSQERGARRRHDKG